MEVFGYTRISVDLDEDSRENTSIENQKKIITDFVGSTFPDAHLTLFEDRDRSGYTFSQRESYQKMRSRMMSGECTILVVKDFSRFSRRNSLGLLELETLRDAGIRIISIGDGIDYPTKDDWMLIQFKFLMNEMPVTDTSRKIKQIIQSRQKDGKWVCAVPYGYRIINTKAMTYEIDPPAAEVVREIFRMYNNGWGYKKIANYLTDNGVPTPVPMSFPRKRLPEFPPKSAAAPFGIPPRCPVCWQMTSTSAPCGRRSMSARASTARIRKWGTRSILSSRMPIRPSSIPAPLPIRRSR